MIETAPKSQNYFDEIKQFAGELSTKLDKKYSEMGNWLDRHPTVYKVAVIAMHVMRAISMAALMFIMPFHPLLNFSLSLIASEIYRIVIERHCAFKFAELSCLGGEALLLSHHSLSQLTHQIALETFKRVSLSLLGIVPLAAYLGAVIAISIKNVDEKLSIITKATEQTKSCCPA